MSDFEALPIGTAKRLQELEAYARRASIAMARMAEGGRHDVKNLNVAGHWLADPLFCEARVETRIRNAGRRRGRG